MAGKQLVLRSLGEGGSAAGRPSGRTALRQAQGRQGAAENNPGLGFMESEKSLARRVRRQGYSALTAGNRRERHWVS